MVRVEEVRPRMSVLLLFYCPFLLLLGLLRLLRMFLLLLLLLLGGGLWGLWEEEKELEERGERRGVGVGEREEWWAGKGVPVQCEAGDGR